MQSCPLHSYVKVIKPREKYFDVGTTTNIGISHKQR